MLLELERVIRYPLSIRFDKRSVRDGFRFPSPVLRFDALLDLRRRQVEDRVRVAVKEILGTDDPVHRHKVFSRQRRHIDADLVPHERISGFIELLKLLLDQLGCEHRVLPLPALLGDSEVLTHRVGGCHTEDTVRAILTLYKRGLRVEDGRLRRSFRVQLLYEVFKRGLFREVYIHKLPKIFRNRSAPTGRNHHNLRLGVEIILPAENVPVDLGHRENRNAHSLNDSTVILDGCLPSGRSSEEALTVLQIRKCLALL